jgi:hypothetical protein
MDQVETEIERYLHLQDYSLDLSIDLGVSWTGF